MYAACSCPYSYRNKHIPEHIILYNNPQYQTNVWRRCTAKIDNYPYFDRRSTGDIHTAKSLTLLCGHKGLCMVLTLIVPLLNGSRALNGATNVKYPTHKERVWLFYTMGYIRSYSDITILRYRSSKNDV